MSDKETVNSLMSRFDAYRRTPKGNVVIHPGLTANLIELTEDFVQSLKNDLQNKISMAHAGIDELDPATKFAIMILIQSY